jgi:hypothetical protein
MRQVLELNKCSLMAAKNSHCRRSSRLKLIKRASKSGKLSVP